MFDAILTSHPSPRRTHFASATAAVFVVLTLYTLMIVGIGRPAAWIACSAINAAALSLVWLIAILLRGSRLPHARLVAAALFYPAAVLVFLANFAYFYFFESAATRRFSLLEVSAGQVSFFFARLLPPDGWLWLALLSVAVIALGLLIARRAWSYPPRLPMVALLASIAGTSVCAAFVPDIPHPFVDVVQDVAFRWSHATARLDPLAAPGGSITLLNKSSRGPAAIRTRFKKIVVVVMETVPVDQFANESAVLPPQSFVRAMRQHAHSFDQYFTPNQDSRTAVLDMLLSRFIPYEAYDDESEARYTKVSGFPSLPAHLHALGYHTAYVLGQELLEIIVQDLPWQKTVNLSLDRIAATKPHALCFHPYEFENSCEDKVLIPDVMQQLRAHEKVFVLHELIWGHDEEYFKASGKTNVRYVSEYLDALWREITAQGMADETLLVLTADHGDKAEDRLPLRVAYQVPLFFFASSFHPRHNASLYSHLDFEQLLLRELDPRRRAVPPEPFVEIIGPTGSSVRAVVDSAGGFVVYTPRSTGTYIMAQRGTPAPDVGRHVKLVDEYRAWFDSSKP